jgi:hypothetical protein
LPTARARSDELELLQQMKLWVEAYGRSLVAPDGPWADFARSTVDDWLELLKSVQPGKDSKAAQAWRTGVLAVLRGGLLDLLATGDTSRTTAAVLNALEG